MYYYETNKKIEANESKPSNMVAYVEVNGAKGYITLTGIDIIPLIYAENSALAPFFVKLSDSSQKILYPRNDGRKGIIPELTKYHVINGELQIDIDRATSAGTSTYAKAPSWLTNGTYYSSNGINFYIDPDLEIPVLDNGQVGNFYNYFSYLNLRTKTKYTPSEIDSYLSFYDNQSSTDFSTSKMKDMAFAFIDAQDEFGMNALQIYAFAIHESAYGMSFYAQTKNNLFGYGASTSNPSDAYEYESIEESIDIHMGKQMRYYLDYNNSNLFYGSNFGNKGAGANTRYADDPFWSTKIAGHAYRIDRYLGFKDYNAYQIAILDQTVSSTLYKESSLINTLYSINTRATNYPFTIKASHNDTYYVQSTNPIVNNVVVTSSTTGLIPYNFDLSQAYINKNQVKLVNTPLTPVTIISDTDNLVLSVKRFEWLDSNIYLKGYAALANTNMASLEVTHTLVAYNLEDEDLKYYFDLNLATPDNNVTLLNPFDYTKAWFDGIIDLSLLPLGHYRFEVETTAGQTSGKVVLTNSLANAPRTAIKTIEGITYTQRFHNKLKMRYELSIEKGIEIENRSEYLPSQINSIAFINSITLIDGLLTMNGISFINKANMGDLDQVKHELILVDSSGVQNKYILESGRGNYDISYGGFDYSNAWFYADSLDISMLLDGTYQLYIATYTNQVNDVLRILDHNNTGTREFTYSNRVIKFEVNTALRNTYFIKIETVE
jgi:hypothetical protein